MSDLWKRFIAIYVRMSVPRRERMGNHMRLIDADAYEHSVQGNPYVSDSMKTYVRCSIQSQPTIDAEPVRHGKWIGYAGTIGNECSVCGKWIDVLQGTAEMNYCPNCGARMDKE